MLGRLTLNVQAADFPERPLRLIVPFAAGAGQDITGRLLAQRLTDAWSQQVVVDNRPGAGSNIGVEIGARALPDGYKLLLASMAKVEMTHVPYKGVAPAMTDLLVGQIQLIGSTVLSAMPQIQCGKLRGLAVTTTKRSAALPNVPTVAESGVPGYEATAWSMLMAPANTPRAVITRVNASTARVLDNAEVRKCYAAEGGEAVGSPPEVAAKYLAREIQCWAKVIKDAGVRGEN